MVPVQRVIHVLALLLVSTGAASQMVTTLAPPTPTEFSGDLAVDSAGNIFAANFGTALNQANGGAVWKVMPGGEFSLFATGFLGASGNTFDAQGNLFQSNIAANRIDRVTPDGTRTVFTTDGIVNPVGLAHDSAGNLYVANCGNSTIRMITPQGQASTFAASALLSCPNGLTIDDQDTLYAANFNNGNIIRMPQGGVPEILASTPASVSKPNGGNGHIIFGNDRLYVVSNATHQVFELLLDGTLNLIAGSGVRGRADGPLLEAQFSLPNGIDLSPDGTTLYVNDSEGLVDNNDIAPNVIRVIPLPNISAPFSINPGLNDAWFNPDTPGQGFFINVFPDFGVVFLAWFTYDVQRPPQEVTAILGEPGHRWVTAIGAFDGDTVTADVELTAGGIFDSGDPAVMQSGGYGTITVAFHDCETATLTYSIPDAGVSGEIQIERIVSDNVALCEALSALP